MQAFLQSELVHLYNHISLSSLVNSFPELPWPSCDADHRVNGGKINRTFADYAYGHELPQGPVLASVSAKTQSTLDL